MESTTALINRLVMATLTTGWECARPPTTLTGGPVSAYAATVGEMLARGIGASNYSYASPTRDAEAIGVLADIAAYRRLLPPALAREHPAKMLCLCLGTRAMSALAADAAAPTPIPAPVRLARAAG